MYDETHALSGDTDDLTPVSTSLVITTGRGRKLTKIQHTFNRLTMRIEELQDLLRIETGKLESLLTVYLAEIPPQKRALAESRLAIAKALAASTQTIEYSRHQRDNVREVILGLCDEAFVDLEPDRDMVAFYDTWSETSYHEETRLQAEMMKRRMADHARTAFGIDIDPDETDDSAEGLARFAKRLQNEFKDAARQQSEQRHGGKKSKKQMEREKLRTEEEERTLRSMRSIYLSLAKALHPDTITDPAEKAAKEELMKKVTAAYATRDLPALLGLEMEWVRSEGRSLDTLPDDQLRLYIALLTEQVETLEQERRMQHRRQRYAGIADFSRFSESVARQLIRKRAHEYRRSSAALAEIMTVFNGSGPQHKKKILAFIKSYLAMTIPRQTSTEEFIEEYFS